MQNENEFDKLLIRYLSDETDDAEAEAVKEWINTSDENRRYFEELQNTWRLMVVLKESGKIDIESEWDRFAYSREQLTRPRRTIIRRLMLASGVAAAIAITIIGLIPLFRSEKISRQSVARTSTTNIRQQTLTERNYTGREREIMLEDGSMVVLHDKSEITFYKPFPATRRDIVLRGRAGFSVAKDSAKPFIVYSGDITTQALGTKFLVTAFDDVKNTTVRLFEGKVVVKRMNTDDEKEGFYLVPGQEFIYDGERKTASVHHFGNAPRREEVVRRRDDSGSDEPLIPVNEKGSWYMFNNQSLSVVFDQLQEMYNVKIDYTSLDLSDKYFIGKFDKTDSIEMILRRIALVNNLKISRDSNRFVVQQQ